MKTLRRLGWGLLLVALMALPAPGQAQEQGTRLQVWFVDRDITDTIEYRDSAGGLLEFYTLSIRPGYTLRAAGNMVLDWRYGEVAVFDPATGVMSLYPEAAMPGDGSEMDYSRAEPVARVGEFAYAVTYHHDPAATSWILTNTLPPGETPTVLLEQTMANIYTGLNPLGFSADGSQLLLAERPVGLGGYILFWQWGGVQVLDRASGMLTPVDGDVDGFSADLQHFGAVLWGDEIPTLHVFSRDGAQHDVYPMPQALAGETIGTGGNVHFSPDGTRVAYQLARHDPENEKFWTIVVNRATGEQAVVLEDAGVMHPYFGYISGWLDDTTLVVGGGFYSATSALIDVITGDLLGTVEGVFLGYAEGIDRLAPSGEIMNQCQGAPVSRLSPGALGRVTITNDVPVNVRETPGGAKLGTQPEGATFEVWEGPICQDGYAWWEVLFTDLMTGYVAEGDATGYFLEPWQ